MQDPLVVGEEHMFRFGVLSEELRLPVADSHRVLALVKHRASSRPYKLVVVRHSVVVATGRKCEVVNEHGEESEERVLYRMIREGHHRLVNEVQIPQSSPCQDVPEVMTVGKWY